MAGQIKTILDCELVEFHDSKMELITIGARGVEIIFRGASVYFAEPTPKESYEVCAADLAVRLSPLLGISMLEPLPVDVWVLDVDMQGSDGAALDAGRSVPPDGVGVRLFRITFNNGSTLTFLAERMWLDLIQVGKRKETWDGPL